MPCFRSSLGPLACAALLALSCSTPTGVDRSAGVDVASVSVDPPASTVTLGAEVPLHAAVMDADGQLVPDALVVWTVRDPGIATVSSSGIVTGRAIGSTQVAASAGGRSALAAITVRPVPVASVVVQPGSVSLAPGSTTTLAAVVTTANGAAAPERTVTWTTSDALVAVVSSTGVVTAVGPGSATIGAESEGKTGTATVTVSPAAPASVTVEPSDVTVQVGRSATLTATVKDASGNVLVGRAVDWSTSNPSVATVSPAGSVAAVAVGSATISATINGKSGTATVTVTLVPVGSVAVQPRTVSLTVGQTTPLSAVVTDAQGAATDRAVTWTSGNQQVATVSSNGVVTAVAPGQAIITAASEGKSGAATITVAPSPVASVAVAPSNSALTTGETTALVATVRDARGVVVTDRPVTWKSSNEAAATVSAAGVVTAVAPGTATITATSETKSGTAVVSVAAVPVGSVAVAPTSANLVVGGSTVLAATVRDVNGTVVTDRPVTWSTSNAGVATVSSTGVVAAVAPGSATITASAGTKSGAATIIVTAVPVGSVTIAPTSKSLLVGGTTTLVATVKDVNGAVVSDRAVVWSTSDPLVATVSSSGVVTALAPGSVTVTATSESKSGSSAITVSPVPVAKVTVEPPSMALVVGQTSTAKAVLTDANGNVLTGRVVTWTSNNPLIASVSSTGIVTGIAPGGPVFITASSEGLNGSTSVTVTAVPVGSVTLPATTTLVAGQSTTLTPVVKDANGAVVTDRAVTWSSSNTNVATVSASGLVRALVTGTATITATSEGQQGSTALTVTPAPVGSVTVAPFTLNLASGSTVTLAATVKDVNGTTVTDRTITWKSSDTDVATVSADGVLTGLVAGTATITATSEGRSGTATVTVVPGPAATVTVTPSTTSVKDGANVQLSASAVDAHGNAVTGRGFAWASSNTSIATVSAGGRVTGRKTGVVTITAVLDGAKDSSQVTVTP
jgi:Bacterial surface proteins containing Ig-like domains